MSDLDRWILRGLLNPRLWVEAFGTVAIGWAILVFVLA